MVIELCSDGDVATRRYVIVDTRMVCIYVDTRMVCIYYVTMVCVTKNLAGGIIMIYDYIEMGITYDYETIGVGTSNYILHNVTRVLKNM